MQEDTNSVKRRGRKRKNTGRETQHVAYVEPEIWDAADGLPIPRQDIIRQALVDAISFYKDDLPKLKYERAALMEEKQKLDSKISLIDRRIEQLEAKAVIEVNELQRANVQLEAAINETLVMCKAFKKDMEYGHYAKLSELSGLEAAKIEVFLKDSKFRPSEESVRIFYRG